MSVKERLKEYIKSLNITQLAFEKSINAKNGYVNSITNGIGLEKMNLIIEKYPKLNVEWLLYGLGEMIKTETNEINIESYQIADLSTEELIQHLESEIEGLKKQIRLKQAIINRLKQ
jgi:transcriptional regulator with XRE-family HTH domain